MIIKIIKYCLILLILFPFFSNGDVKIKKGDFSKIIVLGGSIEADKAEYFYAPRVRGRTQIKWMLKEGKNVKVGDPVIRLDTSNLSTEIETLEMSLNDKREKMIQKEAEIKHDKFEVEVLLKKAEIEYKKIKIDASVPKGILPNYEYDKTQLELIKKEKAFNKAKMDKKLIIASIDSDIKKMKIDIQEEEEKLKKNKDLLKYLTLSAKTEGSFVYSLHPWEGRKFQLGDFVYTSFTIGFIPDENSLQVKAWVNETDINSIMKGQKVEMILDAYQGTVFTGFVKEVSKNAEKRKIWGKAHYFAVIIKLDSLDLKKMKPGMSIKCSIETAYYKQCLFIPIDYAFRNNKKFWIKKKGENPVIASNIGTDSFYLALNEDGVFNEGDTLEKLTEDEIKEIKNEKK